MLERAVLDRIKNKKGSNMKNWMQTLLKIIPIEVIFDFIIEWLKDEVKKTPGEFDDKLVAALEVIIDTILAAKKK
jgi:hypothetical protein